MAARHSRVYPEGLNLAGLDVLIFFFWNGGGVRFKEFVSQAFLRGIVSQLLPLQLAAAAELCNKMLGGETARKVQSLLCVTRVRSRVLGSTQPPCLKKNKK